MVRLSKGLTAGALLWLGLFIQAGGAFSAPDAGYSFGVVPQYDHRQLFATWSPVLDELNRRTGLSFRIVLAPDITAFEKECLEGAYDFVYLNPYHILKANQAMGYRPILRDSQDLRGILVVRRDSPAKSPADLNGGTVAFPAPNALGASLLMRADLSNVFHVRITPLYVTSHDSVYLHVAGGLVDAGGGVMKTLAKQEASVRESLRILYVTRPMPSHPVASHPRISDSDIEKVRDAFLQMASVAEGRALLSKIPMNDPVPASLGDYTPMMGWGLEGFWVED